MIPIPHIINKIFKSLICPNISRFKISINGFMIGGKTIVFVNWNSNGKNKRRQVINANINNKSDLNKR